MALETKEWHKVVSTATLTEVANDDVDDENSSNNAWQDMTRSSNVAHKLILC